MDAPSTTSEFGRKVKAQIRKNGISLREFASRMDESPSSMCRKLQGNRPVTLEEANRMALELHVPLWSLLPS